MEQFPHLKFIQKLTGRPRFPGGGSQNERSRENKNNRERHGAFLGENTRRIKADWANEINSRDAQELAAIDSEIIPVLIQINPDLFKVSGFNLQAFGIEIISEENEGFIIGASLDNLHALEEKITGFINETHGSAKIADFWNIIEGERKEWKPQHILSDGLLAQWSNITDEALYKVEVGIAFDKPLGPQPDPERNGGQKRLERYREKLIERDEARMGRETHFEQFIEHYGTRTSDYIDLEDSFSCQVEITGKGLKDLVVNYQFVFEVNEVEDIGGIDGDAAEGEQIEFDVLPPEETAPIVGVMDSGIMSDHKYLQPAIDNKGKSYLDGDLSIADYVVNGGHGTRVAGAILYPQGLSNLPNPYQLPCFIRNLRILDANNELLNKYPAHLMQLIVEENLDCHIFNLSVNSKSTFRKKHVSAWAAVIDTLIHKHGVLFLISAGNVSFNAIRDYIHSGNSYPTYLQNPYCKLANPAQSCFGLTVGSINHTFFEDHYWKSLGDQDSVSPFSRIGTGIWNMIKPDVVEYGGGLVLSKNGTVQIREHQETAPELLRSTYHGGNAYSKDKVGTSFSTPKVAYIAAQLKKLYPNDNANLLRAFVAQGARLPGDHFLTPTVESIQHFGYGIPSLERVTSNTEHRITFYNTGEIKAEEAHIYSMQIPDALRNPGNDYDILLEVTLAYTAKVRRTRQRTKSYLSTWLDWTTSKMDESFDEFRQRTLVDSNTEWSEEDESADTNNVFKWKIRERNHWGEIRGLNRNNSTLQKDWVILKSYELPSIIGFSIRGHKGWDVNKEGIPYALTVSMEVLGANIPIYELIKVENEVEITV